MLFRLLKIPAKLAVALFCKKIIIANKEVLSMKGPLLIACNHPNAFLDAIVLSVLFKKPVYSLARGDAFKNKFINKFLRALNMLPVYRLSEGADHLNNNYETFSACRNIFKKNGIVLIFSEGTCVNEWKLRPLKKGTARLAFSAWEEGIDLAILPTGINYHSFSSYGKHIQINFEKPLNWRDFENKKMDGNAVLLFNTQLQQSLKNVVIEMNAPSQDIIKRIFQISEAPVKKHLLFVPSVLGKWIHAPIYIPLQKYAWRKFSKVDFYDSVLLGLLFAVYPIYLSLIAFSVYLMFGGWYWLLAFLFIPFLAWSFLQAKSAI